MIANTLIFLLGMLVTALGALVLSPLFWRKAQSLARREFEATIPISANEIRAEFDRVRAEAAVSVRRQEVLSAETREKAARAEADRGRLVVESTEFQKRNRLLTQTIEGLDAELAATRLALMKREAENRELAEDLSRLRQSLELMDRELATLRGQYEEIAEQFEGRSAELAIALARIEHLEAPLEPAGTDDEADARVERLTVEIAGLRQALQREQAAAALRDKAMSPGPAGQTADRRKPEAGSKAAQGRRELPALDPLEEADIRERISDVAARVIRMTALAEGPDSPLAPLLAKTTPSEIKAPGSKPTLADRVRLLAEAERKSGT